MTDPHIRVVGTVELNYGALVLGVDYNTVTVTITQPNSRPARRHITRRLASPEAEEFARLFVAACWEAAQQAGTLAQAAELRAAAEEIRCRPAEPRQDQTT